MEITWARPPKEPALGQIRAFLSRLGLDFDENVHTTALLMEDGHMLATGSREGNVLKCIGVLPDSQGEGLAATLLTALVKDAAENGIFHLFVFTKPESVRYFCELGFFPVVETAHAALLENRREGIRHFVASLDRPPEAKQAGAIVANCNPFTNGHLYLMETAAKACDTLHIFVLSEDRSAFSAAERMALVQAGTAHIPNAIVHPTGDYLISSATFPDYFIKDKARAAEINCELDLHLFARQFAKPLNITQRFVGTEPTCPVTSAYNQQMQAILPRYGITVTEIPRIQQAGQPISASLVRKLMTQGRFSELRPLVPETTYRYLERMKTDESASPV